MGNFIPMIISTFIYISLFVYVIASTQIQELREDWNSVRCQPFAMFFASYIPTDPSVNTADFSNKNFQFCMGELMDASINLFMTPVTAIFESQVAVAHTTQQSINNLRNSAASDISSPFHVMINYAWQKFQTIMVNVLRVMYNFNSAFQRIFGITLSALFAGVSVFRVIDNMTSFIIKVIMIILTIIICMLLILFIFIQPLIATIIIPVIVAISATAAGSSAGGMQGAFSGANCVAKGTKVKTKNSWVNVEDLQLGDELWDGTVEGILYGKGAATVLIHSVPISAMHILYDSYSSRWIFAKDHRDAVPCVSPSSVYSLVTSSHTWIVRSPSGIEEELLLRDWTHADGNEELIQRKVCSMLNTPFTGIKGIGLIGPESVVLCEDKSVSISSLNIGDRVWDGTKFTEVTSIYRSNELGNASGPNSSAWRLGPDGWIQHSVPLLGNQVPLIHCGTESGTIVIDGITMRDFNEIEKKDFHALEDFLLSLL
jgi:hypothetical protein